MKILMSEIPEKHPKLVLMFKRETGCKKAIFKNGEITKSFKYWLHQKIKYKTPCDLCNKVFKSRRSMLNHRRYHNKEFREKMSKIQNNPEYHKKKSKAMKGNKNSNWDKNGLHYDYIHKRAHKVDPKPEDGICELCGKVKDENGKTKLVHSNKDHSYRLPINPDEWWWIHKSCHEKYDRENNK